MRDTIDMAREAAELKCDCCLPYYEETDIEGFEGFLKRFEALIRADERSVEREAIKAICKAEQTEDSSDLWNVCCTHIINKINERKA